MKKASTMGLFALSVGSLLCTVATSQAAVTLYSDLSAWEGATSSYAETTNFGVPDGSTITGFTTTDGVSVGVSEGVESIGDGWNTWSGGYSGQILADYSSLSVTYTLNTPVSAFGFFAEPDPYETYDISLETSTGQTLTESVNGFAGASFFGWTGAGVTSFTVASATDFATGDFYSGTAMSGVPEASTWAMMLIGFAGLGFAGYRQSTKSGAARAAA